MRTTTNCRFPIPEKGDPIDYNPSIELLDNFIFNLMNTDLEVRLNQYEPTIRTEKPRRYIRPGGMT